MSAANRHRRRDRAPVGGRWSFAPALLAAATLAAPTSASPTSIVLVQLCGGGLHPLELPDRPDPTEYCQKACHACLVRKAKRGSGHPGEAL